MPDTPLSRASPLPHWSGGNSTIFSATRFPVGAGLPAKAAAGSRSSLPDTPLSRASPLPQ
ncbi:hypothetical protein CXF97_01030 [Pseudomonas sp. Choline-02u-1]|nr:hypothetical protein CXF97_01030 [Pseudomonas sp. Choline-02u-1]